MEPVNEIRRRNLRLLREEAGGTWAALNRRMGRNERDSTYHQIWRQAINSGTGKPRGMGSRMARSLEDAFEKPTGWMDTPQDDHKSNVTRPEPPAAKVPLISFVQAGQMSDINDPFQPGEADEWISVGKRVGPNAFALRVQGDSMTSQFGQPSFPEGMVIIVDPGQSATAGDYVIAKDTGTQSATFKRLMYDGGRWFLKPLNSAYPAQEIDRPELRVIGKVVGWRAEGWL